MTKISKIHCRHENHRGMIYEYVCLNKTCRDNGDFLACLYCCEQYHKNHIADMVAAKQIITEIENKNQGKQYNVVSMLLLGVQTCKNFEEIKTNFGEILALRENPKRFDRLLDQEMKGLHENAIKYYQRNTLRQTERTLTSKSINLRKEFITPILSFKQGPQYQFNSPFSVTSKENELTTIFAYPSLSKFHQSIDIKIKIDRYTPSWLAIGLSVGQTKYQEKSTKHLLAISNGWISNKGQLVKSSVKFGAGDVLRVKWDKNLQLLEIISSKNEKCTYQFESKWNEEVYLCVCLFYKGDSISILS